MLNSNPAQTFIGVSSSQSNHSIVSHDVAAASPVVEMSTLIATAGPGVGGREGPYWWSGGKICTISLISELLGAAIKFLKNNNRLRLLQLQQTERGDPCPPGELSRWHKTVLFVQCLPARLFRWKRFCIFLSPSHRPSPFLTYLFLLYPKKEEEVRCRVLACLLNESTTTKLDARRTTTNSLLPSSSPTSRS